MKNFISTLLMPVLSFSFLNLANGTSTSDDYFVDESTVQKINELFESANDPIQVGDFYSYGNFHQSYLSTNGNPNAVFTTCTTYYKDSAKISASRQNDPYWRFFPNIVRLTNNNVKSYDFGPLFGQPEQTHCAYGSPEIYNSVSYLNLILIPEQTQSSEVGLKPRFSEQGSRATGQIKFRKSGNVIYAVGQIKSRHIETSSTLFGNVKESWTPEIATEFGAVCKPRTSTLPELPSQDPIVFCANVQKPNPIPHLDELFSTATSKLNAEDLPNSFDQMNCYEGHQKWIKENMPAGLEPVLTFDPKNIEDRAPGAYLSKAPSFAPTSTFQFRKKDGVLIFKGTRHFAELDQALYTRGYARGRRVDIPGTFEVIGYCIRKNSISGEQVEK